MKKLIKELKTKNNAITLIALVITIVILIILASVAITMSLSNTGLFSRVKQAREDYQTAANEELIKYSNLTNNINSIVGHREENGDILKDIEMLKSKVQQLEQNNIAGNRTLTYTLIAESTSKTTTNQVDITEEKTLDKFNYIQTCFYTSSGNIYSSGIVPMTYFKNATSLCAASPEYIAYAKYISDSSIIIYNTHSTSSKVQVFGIN